VSIRGCPFFIRQIGRFHPVRGATPCVQAGLLTRGSPYSLRLPVQPSIIRPAKAPDTPMLVPVIEVHDSGMPQLSSPLTAAGRPGILTRFPIKPPSGTWFNITSNRGPSPCQPISWAHPFRPSRNSPVSPKNFTPMVPSLAKRSCHFRINHTPVYPGAPGCGGLSALTIPSCPQRSFFLLNALAVFTNQHLGLCLDLTSQGFRFKNQGMGPPAHDP